MADYKKVWLKNGLGEYVYPEIDPDDKGGDASSRAFLFHITDSFDGNASAIKCYDLKKPLSDASEGLPFEEVTAEEYCRSFVPGGSVQIFVAVNEGDILFSSNWSYGDETLNPAPFLEVMVAPTIQMTSQVAQVVSSIEWHGIAWQGATRDIGDIIASPAQFHMQVYYNGDDGSVTFDGYYFLYDSCYTSNSKPYSFHLVYSDKGETLNLRWTTSNDTAFIFANTKQNVESGTIYADIFNYWYYDINPLDDLFRDGNNNLYFSADSDDQTAYCFKLISPTNDSGVATFAGINCNKTLTLTLAQTDPASDPFGKAWSYPYISAYELKDNGGGGSSSFTKKDLFIDSGDLPVYTQPK